MAKDLRSFLSELEAEEPDQLLRVKKEVDPHFEVTGVLAKLEKERKFPVVVFEKVQGSSLPVVTNVHADARRLFERQRMSGEVLGSEHVAVVREHCATVPQRAEQRTVVGQSGEATAVSCGHSGGKQ
jgi:UbiD family decarboxylase